MRRRLTITRSLNSQMSTVAPWPRSLGGIFLIFGLYATWQQLAIAARGATLSERRFVEERMDRAIERLTSGDPLLIRATVAELSAIAATSEQQRCRVQSLLVGLVRSSRPLREPREESTKPPREDQLPDGLIEFTLSQLQPAQQCEPLDLSRLDLTDLRLNKISLQGAVLSGTRLDGVHLSKPVFRGHSWMVLPLTARPHARESLASHNLSASQLQWQLPRKSPFAGNCCLVAQ